MADDYEESTSSNYTTPDKTTTQIRQCPLIDGNKWTTLTNRTFTLLNAQKDAPHMHQLQVTHDKLKFQRQIEDTDLKVTWTIVQFSDPAVKPFVGEYFIYKCCGTMFFLRPLTNLIKYCSVYLPAATRQTIQAKTLTDITDAPQVTNTNSPNTDEEISFKNRHTQHTDKDTASTEDDQSSTNSFQNGQRLTESPSNPPPPPPSSTTSNSQSVNILDPLASAMSISNITNVTLDVPTNNIHNTQPGPQQIAAAALREKDREIATMLEAVGKQSAYENKLKREIALHLRQNTNLNSMVEHLTKELQAKQALLTNINNDKDTLQQGASGHSQHNTHNQ